MQTHIIYPAVGNSKHGVRLSMIVKQENIDRHENTILNKKKLKKRPVQISRINIVKAVLISGTRTRCKFAVYNHQQRRHLSRHKFSYRNYKRISPHNNCTMPVD